MHASIGRGGLKVAAEGISVDRIASLGSWVKECHELYLKKDAQALARRAPEFLELTPFLRGYELSMLANHFAMIKLQREDFCHAVLLACFPAQGSPVGTLWPEN
ncbi:hypothetical protein FOZ62_018980 [Perkinsus olseni]|uniref:Uncharacterized protein n=1 Tax=Perkinsus olseni TaxID=32597 RepID=A0A7J6T8V7_PEROL|nr:hypothetical protein FOZ62_018980 [Perkinsus olseni]